MKYVTLRKALALIPIIVLVVTRAIADKVHDYAFWYLGVSDKGVERLSNWIWENTNG